MKQQNQIKHVLSAPESIEYIQSYSDAHKSFNRVELAAHLCKHFGFIDAKGRTQIQATTHALRQMDRFGEITLPKINRTKHAKTRQPSRLAGGVPPTVGEVPADVGDVLGLRLVLVEQAQQRMLWNELMIRDHPNGHGPLVGRQIRYLIESDHGVLGGFGFSACAVTLEDRDNWMCWDGPTRRRHLDKIIGMSRFLIRREVSCTNLASKLLSMVVKQMPEDFLERYGYRPLLIESFVDSFRFTGTVYRAANWELVGQTKGRGRNDRDQSAQLSKKAIYLYVLDSAFRKKLSLPEPPEAPCLDPTEGLELDQWAKREFYGSSLGDARLSERLVRIGAMKAANPGQSWLDIVQGDRGETKAYYRFIASPDDSKVTFENILNPHREQTIARMRGQSVVLAIQDTSDLNFNTLNACTGLGINGKNSSQGAGSKGLKLHSTFVVNNDGAGLPLGVLRSDCYARKSTSGRSSSERRELPIEEKESYRWLEGIKDCAEVARGLSDTQVVCVADREADIFELFEYQQKHPEVELLIRAAHERASLRRANVSLFEQLRSSNLKASFELEVPARSARAAKSSQKSSDGSPARSAKMQLRYKSIELPPPDSTLHRNKQPIKLWMVHLAEVDAPAGIKPIEWFLMTTLPVKNDADALQCVRWYRARWRIEEWHRVLKSGCNIEKVKNRSAGNIKRAIAVDLVVAWRIMLMSLLGRQCGELPAELIFTPMELEVLKAYCSKKN